MNVIGQNSLIFEKYAFSEVFAYVHALKTMSNGGNMFFR